MKSMVSQELNFAEIGKRLKQARKRSGLTQADAAQLLGVARTTISAVENGERKLKSSELAKLAKAYGRPTSDFVSDRPFLDIPNFQLDKVQFRSSHTKTDADEKRIEPKIEMVAKLARNYRELEIITNNELHYNYPREYRYSTYGLQQAAESIAIAERNRLSLGDAPLPPLRPLFEREIGLRVFYVSMEPSNKFDEIYFFTPDLGGVIAVDKRKEKSVGRCRFSLAHAYAHFLVDRVKPIAADTVNKDKLPPSERFADKFAESFLMPSSGVAQKFNSLYQTNGKVTPGDLVALAYHFGVSFQAMVWRLEKMKLVPTRLHEKLTKEYGFRPRNAAEMLGIEKLPEPTDKLPERYKDLAVEAYNKELITEGELAKFLQTDRLNAREVVHQHHTDTQRIIRDNVLNLSPA